MHEKYKMKVPEEYQSKPDDWLRNWGVREYKRINGEYSVFEEIGKDLYYLAPNTSKTRRVVFMSYRAVGGDGTRKLFEKLSNLPATDLLPLRAKYPALEGMVDKILKGAPYG